MWMQNSAAGGNFHDRNRFGSQQGQNSYNGRPAPDTGTGDWKRKILESGQWLGGKVIEYGGKLARGPSTDSMPDQYAQQMPRNDGRANWMADIRSNTSLYSRGGIGGYNVSGGYQNDFATERPNAYSDYNKGYSRNPSEDFKNSSLTDHHKSRYAEPKNERKKSKKKSKKSSKKPQSESNSEFPSESDELSISESSESESLDERRRKSKKKTKAKQHSGFYSESESDHEGAKRKASAEYAFSFDPANLPPPPAEVETTIKSKPKKSKKEKTRKKSHRRSVASSDKEFATANIRVKAKKRSGKKTATASASVDLLGVDLDAHSATTTQEVQPSIFDPPPRQNPLQDLTGLSFATPALATARMQPSISPTASATPSQQVETLRSNLLPENNIVDLSNLASGKKKTLSAHPEEKRTLNDLQKARGSDQLTPVMPIPIQQLQQQNFAHGMMQLSMSMSQLQLPSDGSNQLYPTMQSQLLTMPPQMVGMVQPQMPRMHQVAQDGTYQPSHSLATGLRTRKNSGSIYQMP